MNGEVIDQLGNGKNPQHRLPRRGEQQVAPGVPGVRVAARERCHAAGVDELQARQIHDDLPLAARDSHKRSRHTRGVYQVKLPAQCDDDMAVAFAGTQIYAEHGYAFLLQQQGGVLTQRLVRQLPP
jgi:hypothetical protein